MITDPPLDADAVNGTDALLPDTVTVPTVGAHEEALESTVMAFDGADELVLPQPFRAVTTNV